MPNSSEEFEQLVPGCWFSAAGREVYLIIKDKFPLKQSDSLTTFRETFHGFVKGGQSLSDAILMANDKGGGKETCEIFKKLCLNIMENPKKRSLTLRTTSDAPTGLFGASSAAFGNLKPCQKLNTVFQIADCFRSKDVTRVGLGLMIEYKSARDYREGLLERFKTLKQFRINLAALMSPFVRNYSMPRSPGSEEFVELRHYFFGDLLDFYTVPTFAPLDLNEDTFKDVIVDLEDSPSKKRSDSPGAIGRRILRMKSARLNDGKINPRVAHAVQNLVMVSATLIYYSCCEMCLCTCPRL